MFFLLFFMAMFVPWATPFGAWVAAACATAVAVAVAYYQVLGLTFIWMLPASFVAGAAAGADHPGSRCLLERRLP